MLIPHPEMQALCTGNSSLSTLLPASIQPWRKTPETAFQKPSKSITYSISVTVQSLAAPSSPSSSQQSVSSADLSSSHWDTSPFWHCRRCWRRRKTSLAEPPTTLSLLAAGSLSNTEDRQQNRVYLQELLHSRHSHYTNVHEEKPDKGFQMHLPSVCTWTMQQTALHAHWHQTEHSSNSLYTLQHYKWECREHIHLLHM